MPWRSLVATIDAAAADRLADHLLEAGAASVSLEDPAAGTADETPIFAEPGMPAERIWARTTLRALVPEALDVDTVLAIAAAHAGLDRPLRYRVETLADENWVEKTQAQFEPIRISPRLWIVPSWHTPIDAAAINITLDPGLAFGTGSHPTTQLCLRWLEATLRPGASVLDYGCGSGILAIAAAKLGAARVVGVDIDPDAIAVARANARNNRVVAEFVASTEPLAMTADLLVANILANPLRVLAPAIAAHVRSGGRVALAGLLEPQADELIDTYAAAFSMRVGATAAGWALLEGERR